MQVLQILHDAVPSTLILKFLTECDLLRIEGNEALTGHQIAQVPVWWDQDSEKVGASNSRH